jgi:hypothetical protein
LDARVVRAVIQPYGGPRTYSAEYNRDELDRLTAEVVRLTRELARNIPALPVGEILRRDGQALKFSTLNRVMPPAAGLTVVLPAAAPAQAGLPVDVAVMSAAGAVTIAAAGSLVNGAASVTGAAGVGMLRAVWDGSGWWL